MARVVMRAVRPGEVPPDGGTALQEDPDRPVFRGNGPDDFVCVQCGNVLAASMDEQHMTYKVRVKCGADLPEGAEPDLKDAMGAHQRPEADT